MNETTGLIRGSKVSGHKSRINSHGSQVAGNRSQVEGRRSQVAQFAGTTKNISPICNLSVVINRFFLSLMVVVFYL